MTEHLSLARIHRGIKALPALPLEEELHRLLDRFEEQPEGRLFAPLADCYRRLGRLDEAYKVCVDGLTRHPRYSTGFVILGKIHLDREEGTDARTAFETVLSIDPENLVALRHLALDAEQRGDHDGAVARWEQVRALDPDGRDAEDALAVLEGATMAPPEASPASPDVALAAGANSKEDSGSDAVLEKQSQRVENEPEILVAMSREDSLHLGQGVQRTDGGDEAETIITVTLADIYCEQGFKAKALEMYRTVLERYPEAAKVAGLQEKVDQIEAEMESLAKRFQQTSGEAPEAQLEDLESSAPPLTPPEEEDAQDDGVQKFREWVQKRNKPGS